MALHFFLQDSYDFSHIAFTASPLAGFSEAEFPDSLLSRTPEPPFFLTAKDDDSLLAIITLTFCEIQRDGNALTACNIADFHPFISLSKTRERAILWEGLSHCVDHSHFPFFDCLIGIINETAETSLDHLLYKHFVRKSYHLGSIDSYSATAEQLIPLLNGPELPDTALVSAFVCDESIVTYDNTEETACPDAHLMFPVDYWPLGFAHYLRCCGRFFQQKDQEQEKSTPSRSLRFSLDTRLEEQAQWLSNNHLTPDTTSHIFAWTAPFSGQLPNPNDGFFHVPTRFLNN